MSVCRETTRHGEGTVAGKKIVCQIKPRQLEGRADTARRRRPYKKVFIAIDLLLRSFRPC